MSLPIRRKLPRFSPGVTEVRYSRRAMHSLRAAERYLRARSPKAAQGFRDEIAFVVDLIANFPEMCPIVARDELRCHVTRRFKYRITYRVVGTAIEIRDVLHPSRSGP